MPFEGFDEEQGWGRVGVGDLHCWMHRLHDILCFEKHLLKLRHHVFFKNHCQNIALLGKNIMFYMMVLVGLIPRSIIQDYDKNIIIQSKV